MPEKPHKKDSLAALFSQLRYFQPERNGEGKWTGRFLVNQSKVDERKREIADMPLRKKALLPPVDCPPDLDGILHLIGEASLELKIFINEHEEAMRQISSFTADSMTINEEISKAIGGMPDDMPMLQRVQIVIGRYRQMFDLLHTIAHDMPTDEIKGHVFRFLEWKGDSFKPLVNQNDASTNEQSEAQEATQGDAGSGKSVYPDTIAIIHKCSVCGETGHGATQCPGPRPSASSEPLPPKDESNG